MEGRKDIEKALNDFNSKAGRMIPNDDDVAVSCLRLARVASEHILAHTQHLFFTDARVIPTSNATSSALRTAKDIALDVMDSLSRGHTWVTARFAKELIVPRLYGSQEEATLPPPGARRGVQHSNIDSPYARVPAQIATNPSESEGEEEEEEEDVDMAQMKHDDVVDLDFVSSTPSLQSVCENDKGGCVMIDVGDGYEANNADEASNGRKGEDTGMKMEGYEENNGDDNNNNSNNNNCYSKDNCGDVMSVSIGSSEDGDVWMKGCGERPAKRSKSWFGGDESDPETEILLRRPEVDKPWDEMVRGMEEANKVKLRRYREKLAGDAADWNTEFQELVERKCASPGEYVERASRIQELFGRFQETAKQKFKEGVVDYYRKGKQERGRGIAGGVKFKKGNIFFKLCVADSEGEGGRRSVYDNDIEPMKAANLEVQGVSNYMNCDIEGLSFPMMVTLDYMGFRAIASSVLPVSQNPSMGVSDTIVYGTENGGLSYYWNERADTLARKAGKVLGIKEHKVITLDKRSVVSLCAAADTEM